MDWFERLTGFREAGYDETRAQLEVVGAQLRSKVNGRFFAIGELELVSLAELRQRAGRAAGSGRPSSRDITADVRRLHSSPDCAGALFQVASQFNLLEMTGPNVTPEAGVADYEHDHTQGPACAIAAGAATIYRNYFVPIAGETGQRAGRQLDGLADLGAGLAAALGRPVSSLWRMQNGYALCSQDGLATIADHLAGLGEAARDELRGRLRIGLHWDVEVTDHPGPSAPPVVSQAFCSALPVAYNPGVQRPAWAAFATLVLEAAYEATLWAAVLNARRGASRTVLLTRLGGGAFGNDPVWIDNAISTALARLRGFDLDVVLVTR